MNSILLRGGDIYGKYAHTKKDQFEIDCYEQRATRGTPGTQPTRVRPWCPMLYGYGGQGRCLPHRARSGVSGSVRSRSRGLPGIRYRAVGGRAHSFRGAVVRTMARSCDDRKVHESRHSPPGPPAYRRRRREYLQLPKPQELGSSGLSDPERTAVGPEPACLVARHRGR